MRMCGNYIHVYVYWHLVVIKLHCLITPSNMYCIYIYIYTSLHTLHPLICIVYIYTSLYTLHPLICICINHPYAEKKIFFQYDDCSPPTAKMAKNVLLLQGEEVFVYYLRTSATCHSTFRVRETNVLKRYCTYTNIVTRFHGRTLTGNLYVQWVAMVS